MKQTTLLYFAINAVVAVTLPIPTWAGSLMRMQLIGVQTTNTQAIVKYRPPSDDACQILVSSTPQMNDIANDVNAILFPGSDSDSRPGTIVNGSYRSIVIGKRQSDLASDGNMYSRALQTDTTYYFSLSCGENRLSGTFKTDTIAAGNSAPDPFPFDSHGFGNYAFPDVDFTNRGRNYIDPQTGVLLKRVTDFANGNAENVPPLPPYEVDDLSHSWERPGDALVNDGAPASYEGAGGENQALFIVTPPPSNTDRGYMDIGSNWLDDLQMLVTGWGDGPNDLDRTIEMCLTIDHGKSCAGSIISAIFPPGQSQVEISAPKEFPKPYLGGWGSPRINVEQLQTNFVGFGTVAVSNNIVTNTTAPLFGALPYTFPLWMKDSEFHVKIAGSDPVCPANDCIIDHPIDSNHLKIVQDLGAAFSGANTYLVSPASQGDTSISVFGTEGFIPSVTFVQVYRLNLGDEAIVCRAMSASSFSNCDPISKSHPVQEHVSSNAFVFTNFGVKLWKANGRGRIRIDGLKYKGVSSSGFSTGYDGNGLSCSAPSVSVSYAPDGTSSISSFKASICIFADQWGNTEMYLFDPRNGDSRLLDQITTQMNWDEQQPTTLWSYTATTGQLKACRYDESKGHFRDLTAEFQSTYPSERSTKYLQCSSAMGATAQSSVISQIHYKYPQIDMNYFGAPHFSNVVGQTAVFELSPTQNAISWWCAFDLRQGDGNQLQFCKNTWDTWPARWGGHHWYAAAFTSDGWIATPSTPLNVAGETGLGEYTIDVSRIYGAASTELTANFRDARTCEELGVINPNWQLMGASGQNCIKINIPREPVNEAPSRADVVTNVAAGSRPRAWRHNSAECSGDGTTDKCWTELQDIKEGDMLIDDRLGPWDEHFMVAKKTPLSDGTIDLVLSRASTAKFCGPASDHATGFRLVLYPPVVCTANDIWVNINNPSSTAIDNPSSYNAHTALHYDSAQQAFTQWTVYQYYLGPLGGWGYGVRQGKTPGFFGSANQYGINMLYAFNGSITGTGALQTHPGYTVDKDRYGRQTLFGLDGRPIGLAGGGDTTAWLETVTLVEGNDHVYKVSSPQPFDRKNRATLGWYGKTLLRDMSGPKSRITDQDKDTFCVADFADECVPHSAAGDGFVSIEHADLIGKCMLGLNNATPCLTPAEPQLGWFVQYAIDKPDTNGRRWRKISSFWGGPGRTNNYANIHGTDGTGWVIGTGSWPNGVRNMLFAAKIPTWTEDGTDRTKFVPLRLWVAGKGSGQARIRFGYDQNLFCSTRQEQCSTGAANGDPYAWLGEPVNWKPCAATCSIEIPTISQRVLYYVVDYEVNGVVTSSEMNVTATD